MNDKCRWPWSSWINCWITTLTSFILQYWRFSHWCCWGFRSFGVWCCVTDLVAHNILKALCSFEMLGSIHPVRQHRVPEDLNTVLNSINFWTHQLTLGLKTDNTWDTLLCQQSQKYQCMYKHTDVQKITKQENSEGQIYITLLLTYLDTNQSQIYNITESVSCSMPCCSTKHSKEMPHIVIKGRSASF